MNRWPVNFLIDCDVDKWGRNFNRELFLQLRDIEDDVMARTERNMTQHDMNITLCVHCIKKKIRRETLYSFCITLYIELNFRVQYLEYRTNACKLRKGIIYSHIILNF